jgi:hypothetical protein
MCHWVSGSWHFEDTTILWKLIHHWPTDKALLLGRSASSTTTLWEPQILSDTIYFGKPSSIYMCVPVCQPNALCCNQDCWRALLNKLIIKMNCSCFVCVWETQCHTVRARHKIRVFENKVVIRELRQEKSESSHMTRMLVFMQVASHC